MSHPGIPGDADSVGLGARHMGLIKLEPPTQVEKLDEDAADFGGYTTLDPETICEGVEGKQLDELLDAIRPPMEWDEGGVRWRQHISREPATRYDIVHLHKQLQLLMKKRHARRDGLCPIRRELFAQCFDELIRQIALNSPERALLLLRVREEAAMTMSAYHALHETALAFGITEADQFIALKAEPLERLEELRAENQELEKMVNKLREDMEHLQESFVYKKAATDKVHMDKMQLIKRTQQMLKQHLNHVMAPAEKKGEEDSECEEHA